MERLGKWRWKESLSGAKGLVVVTGVLHIKRTIVHVLCLLPLLPALGMAGQLCVSLQRGNGAHRLVVMVGFSHMKKNIKGMCFPCYLSSLLLSQQHCHASVK